MTNLLTTKQQHVTMSTVLCTGCGLPNTLEGGLCIHCRVDPRGKVVQGNSFPRKGIYVLAVVFLVGLAVLVWVNL